MWEAKGRFSAGLSYFAYLYFWGYSWLKENFQTHRDAFANFHLFSASLLNISCVSHNASEFPPSLCYDALMLLSSTWRSCISQCSNQSLIFQAYLDVQMTICIWKMSAPTTLQLPINIWKYKIGGCSMQFSTVSLCPVLFNLLLVRHAPTHKAEVVHAFSL